MSILDYELFRFNQFSLSVFHLVYIVVVYASAKIFVLIIRKALSHSSRYRRLDLGSQYALLQIIKYFVWTIVIVLALETLGVKVTILVAGSAALLVGVGLGLQQTFNDIVSGIILLIEGSIKVGDILDVQGEIVKVSRIGLRTSMVVNRDEMDYFLPNSKIVTDQVINWSHNLKWTRFTLGVGVTYGTDVDLVLKILIECTEKHPKIMSNKKPISRLINFGDSSLDFEVYFWSEELFGIEQVKADIRVAIVKAFKEHNVVIPFPQRDLHLKTSDIGSPKMSN
jgi:small-conductance mechanosensitive channel